LTVFVKDFLASSGRSHHTRGTSESGNQNSDSTIDSASGGANKSTAGDALTGSAGSQLALDKKKATHEFFKEVRIVSYQEDIGERVFSFWAIRNVSVSMEEIVPDENIMNANATNMPNLIVPVVQNILSLGKQLSVLSKADLKGALDDIQSKYKDLIPKADILLALTLTAGLISTTEWFDLFYSHFFRPADNGNIYFNIILKCSFL
jgi:hypothetical protein